MLMRDLRKGESLGSEIIIIIIIYYYYYYTHTTKGENVEQKRIERKDKVKHMI